MGRSSTTAPAGITPFSIETGAAMLPSKNHPSATIPSASAASAPFPHREVVNRDAPSPAQTARHMAAGSHARAGTRMLCAPGRGSSKAYEPRRPPRGWQLLAETSPHGDDDENKDRDPGKQRAFIEGTGKPSLPED